MRILPLLIATITSVALFSTTALAQHELQVIGGQFEDVASSVVLTEGGVVLLGNSSSQDNDFSRGYLAFFDQDFEFAWSAITPFNPDFVSETIVDAEIGTNMGTDDLVILTRTLNFTNYNTSFYTFTIGEEEGTFYSQETILESSANQNPVKLVNWRESLYAIGDEEGDAWMIDLGNPDAVANAEYEYWGHPTRTEKINGANVRGDTLYVTGYTEVEGVKQTTVWCWGPDGAPLWANIQPDNDTYGDNYGSDISVHPGGASLLYNEEREDLPLGHGLIRFNIEGGTPSIPTSATLDIYAEGVRLIHHEGIHIKLSTNLFEAYYGLDIVITKLGTWFGFQSTNRLGNNLNNIANDMALADDGAIYIAGTTWGYLNGSSSMCLYRINSIDDIGQIDTDIIPFSLTNDPIFINESNINALAAQPTPIYPNPAHSKVRLSAFSDWKVYNSIGALELTGFGNQIDISSLPAGMYFVIQDGYTASPLQVTR